MNSGTVCISSDEYQLLKKKEAAADNIFLQFEASLRDLDYGKIKKVR
jgi:hypothetical protein